jgi:hypothetical protein
MSSFMPFIAMPIARGYIRPRCQWGCGIYVIFFSVIFSFLLTIPLTFMALVQLSNAFVMFSISRMAWLWGVSYIGHRMAMGGYSA